MKELAIMVAQFWYSRKDSKNHICEDDIHRHICRTCWIQDRTDTGLDGYRTGRIHDRTDTGQDGYRTGLIQDRNAGQVLVKPCNENDILFLGVGEAKC